jgi:hypothetical protein
MNQQRYTAYRHLLSELREWRSSEALEAGTHDDLCDAAEGLLLARDGDDAEEPLARASSTVLGLLALNELDEENASWLLDCLLACGPKIPMAEPLGDAA